MRKIILTFIVLFLTSNPLDVYAQEGKSCIDSFYVLPKRSCLNETIENLNKSEDSSRLTAMSGFFSGIFKHHSGYGDEILKKKLNKNLSSILLASLHRAGEEDKANDYSKRNSLDKINNLLTSNKITVIDNLIPDYPADNDSLIGAFLASGQKIYLQNILQNVSSVNPRILKDAMRVSVIQNMFGSKLSPPDRDSNITKNLCDRYDCIKDKKDFMEVMTVSSALWALTSIAKDHKIIEKELDEFYDNNGKVTKALLTEKKHLAEYIKLLELKKSNLAKEDKEFKSGVEKLLKKYESFEDVTVSDLGKLRR